MKSELMKIPSNKEERDEIKIENASELREYVEKMVDELYNKSMKMMGPGGKWIKLFEHIDELKNERQELDKNLKEQEKIRSELLNNMIEIEKDDQWQKDKKLSSDMNDFENQWINALDPVRNMTAEIKDKDQEISAAVKEAGKIAENFRREISSKLQLIVERGMDISGDALPGENLIAPSEDPNSIDGIIKNSLRLPLTTLLGEDFKHYTLAEISVLLNRKIENVNTERLLKSLAGFEPIDDPSLRERKKRSSTDVQRYIRDEETGEIKPWPWSKEKDSSEAKDQGEDKEKAA